MVPEAIQLRLAQVSYLLVDEWPLLAVQLFLADW